MEFVTKRVDKAIKAEPGLSRSRVLSLYNEAPTSELTLDEFEQYALDRLQLLRGIENCKVRGFEGIELTKKIEQVIIIIIL